MLTFVFCSLTFLILIRIYTKRRVDKFGFVWSDYTCFLAYILLLIYCAVGLRAAYDGAGTHQWNLSAERAIRVARIANVLAIICNPAAFFTKLCITLQILRIFGGIHRGGVFWFCHFTCWFNLLFQTAMMLIAIFHCQPQEKYWLPWIPGKCISPNGPLLVSAIISTATDLALFILPIACIWKLQMSMRQKWGVSAVFATGLFAVFCSIMRIVSTVWFIRAGVNDATWGFLDIALWTFGEVGGGIASSCMLILPQFCRQILPRLRSSLRNSASHGQTTEISSTAKTKMLAMSWDGQPKPPNPLSSNPSTGPVKREGSVKPPPVPPKDSWYHHETSGSSIQLENVSTHKEGLSRV